MTDNMPPVYGEPPRKKRHILRWIFAAVMAVIVIIVIAGIAGGNGNNSNKSPSVSAASPAATPAATSAPAPAPTVVPVTKIAFVITGNVPASDFGELDITYGSDSDNHDVTVPSISGTLRYVVPFNSAAEYYDLSVSFTSAGSIKCKIVAIGPAPDTPLVVSHATATGGSNGSLCDAQAAPDNPDGTSWEDEQ